MGKNIFINTVKAKTPGAVFFYHTAKDNMPNADKGATTSNNLIFYKVGPVGPVGPG